MQLVRDQWHTYIDAELSQRG